MVAKDTDTTGWDPKRCWSPSRRTGLQCGLAPVKGGKVCVYHGGGSKSYRQKSLEKLQVAETSRKSLEAMRALGYDPTAAHKDPAEVLAQLVSDKAREVAWVRMMIDLHTGTDPRNVPSGEEGGESWRTDQLVWGETKKRDGYTGEGPIDETVTEAGLNIWVQWLHQAEDQLAKYASAALKAGVAAKQVEIRKTEALVLVGVIRKVLDSLELTRAQQQRVPEVVPGIIRSLGENVLSGEVIE